MCAFFQYLGELATIVTIVEAIDVVRKAQRLTSDASPPDLAKAIETIVRFTAETYAQDVSSYMDLRDTVPCAWDMPMNSRLLDTVRSKIRAGELVADDDGRWKLLDVGAGYGRDALFFEKEPDVKSYVVENSLGFINILRKLQDGGRLRSDAVYAADMRDLSAIPSGTFQCVRNHAALLHLPMVGRGLGADAAVAEARRVLMRGGVFYVFVKVGDGIQVINTGEGLRGRFYQLHRPESLAELLERNRFEIIHQEQRLEPRSSGDIEWLLDIAIAK